jgi:type I restriction enzyme S subunit
MTADAWPTVPMGQVMTHRKQFLEISDLNTYKRCRVQLHAQGIILRDIVPGAQIKTKAQQVCRPGEFLVAEIDAKVGGFGVVPESLDGAIVSSHYFLFTLNETALDQRFLDFYIRTPAFRDQVAARGSTNYAAIRPHHILQYTIPLPPLDEQRRIVARIEALAAKIQEARALRRQAAAQADAIAAAARVAVFSAAAKAGIVSLAEVATLDRGKFSHRPRNEPRFFGGDHPWIQIAEIEASAKYVRRWTQTLNDDGLAISRKFERGTVLVSIAATIGAAAILDFDCCVPDSIVGVAVKPGTDPEYIYHWLGYVRGHLEEVAPQSAQKNINLKLLSALPIPFLPLADQHRIVAYLDGLQARADALKRLQAETAAQLDALLPSIRDRAFKGQL